MRIDRKSKVFAICIVLYSFFINCEVPQAQLILKEYIPPPTLEFANLDSKISVELYKILKNVIDVERIKAKREERHEDILFNNLYVLLKQLDPKQKDKNLQETDIVRKNALSQGQELFISLTGVIVGAGVEFLTGIPAPFLGEGAKLLGFDLGEYLVLRDISSATVEYPKIGRIEIVYVRSKNRIFVNASLEEPVCQGVFILIPIELKPLRTQLGTYVCPPGWVGLTCPPKAAVKEIIPKLEDVKIVQSPIKDQPCVIQSIAQPTITSSLKISPKKNKYQVEDILTAEFTVTNKGNAPITFDVLTVGGRLNGECPQDKCPDFTWKENITLRPNEVYPYKGALKLEAPGNYHFFTAYRTKEGWNTAIPTAVKITNTKDIFVELASTEYRKTEKRDRILFAYEETLYMINPYEPSFSIKLPINIPKDSNLNLSAHLTISPDGSKIAFPSPTPEGFSIRIVDIVNKQSKQIKLDYMKDISLQIENPNWSPDGSKIAFELFTFKSGWDIYVVNTDGTNLIQLTKSGDNFYPIWLPNSKTIMFNEINKKTWKSYLISVDRSEQAVPLTPAVLGASFSPDGRKIAFAGFNRRLCVGNIRGNRITDIREIGPKNIPIFETRWSPDGSKIVFNDSDFSALYIINADGSNLKRIFIGSAWLVGWIANLPAKKTEVIEGIEVIESTLAPDYFISNQNRVDKAIEWAKSKIGSEEWYGWCLRFVRQAFGLGKKEPIYPLGWGSANDARRSLEKRGIFYSEDRNPPRGVLVFFSTTPGTYKVYGHVGISLGNGKVIHAYSKVREDSIDEIEKLKNIDTYLGWAYPPKEWFGPHKITKNRELPTKEPAPPEPAQEAPLSSKIYLPAPDFELKDTKGNLWRLSDLRGKVVLINFCASWLPLCEAEAESREALFRKMQGRPFQMLEILYSDDFKHAKQYIEKHMTPVLIPPDDKVASSYSVTGVPETFVIDKRGIIREKVIGSRKWDSPEMLDLIEKYLYE